MKLKQSISLLDGKEQVAVFEKVLEMPCLPPIGSKVFFGNGIGSGIGHIVSSITFSESSGEYSVHYTLDVKQEAQNYVDYVDVRFFVNLLSKRQGFAALWIEDEYESLL